MTLLRNRYKTSKAWKVSGLLILMGGAVFAGDLAYAQSNRDMQARINRLENEIDTLSRAVYRGEKPPPGALSGGAPSADIEVRLQQMEGEIRDLRGEVERIGYENQQLRQEMERVTGDLELRMNDLEGGGAQRPFDNRGANNRVYNAPDNNANRPVINTIDNTPPQPDQPEQNADSGYQWSTNNTQGQLGSYTVDEAGNATASASSGPAAMYDQAFSLVKKRQYDQAQRDFEAFLQRYPEHELAGNAKYWLGETYYVRGEFETAARVFAEGYQQFPKGSKAADNLLKLGLSLEASGKPEDACIALRQLKKENPAGETPVLRRAEQEMTRLGC